MNNKMAINTYLSTIESKNQTVEARLAEISAVTAKQSPGFLS